jgi:gliding motility-associated-like protein
MPASLGGYQILASTNGDSGPFVKIGTTLPSDTVFIHNNLAYNTKYTYMIRAVNNDGSKTSSSCKKSVTSYTPQKPESIYLRYATVENNEHIKLEWTAGNDAPISKFKILRSADGSFYDTIFINEDLTTYKPSTEFIDLDADFNAQSYFYQIRVCDSCGVDMLSSVNIARTIHLTGSPDFNGKANNLSWNAYENWVLGIEEYQIFRKIDGSLDPSPGPLFTVPSSQNSYTDDVSLLTNQEGVFSYYVVAIENNGDNGYESLKDASTSNEVEISQETRVILPNAFTPGLPPNDIFKPLTAFIDAAGYSFSIFNKWGQMIFETQDFTKGWDGKHKGEYVDSDSYVYLLMYRTPEGQSIEKRGTVTVVR